MSMTTILNDIQRWYEERGQAELLWLSKWLLCFLWVRYGSKVVANGNRAVIVTGATSGFGLALSKRLHKLGFSVFACYYNDQEPGYAELLELKLNPFNGPNSRLAALDASTGVGGGKEKSDGTQRPQMFLVRMDVRSIASIESAGKEILDLLDVHNMQLACLVNNAGTSRDGPFELSSHEGMRDMIDTNLTGVIMVTKQFLLRIIQCKGRIVNVSSGVYCFPGPALTLYGGIKSAVAYFSDCLQEDLRPYGASCCTVVPGNFFTQSNILYTRVRYLQDSIAQLNPMERQTYASKIKDYSDVIYGLLRAKLAQEPPGTDPRRMAEIFKFNLPDAGELEKSCVNLKARRAKMSPPRRLLLWILGRQDGGGDGTKSLEDSGTIDAFIAAVRLADPPRRLYAGNAYYYYLSGPFTEYLPAILLQALGTLLVENLTR